MLVLANPIESNQNARSSHRDAAEKRETHANKAFGSGDIIRAEVLGRTG